MASTTEIREHVARELDRRTRLGVPAFAGGFLFLLSAIIISSVLSAAPTVGLLQGLAPAISGVADPSESPRANEVRFISHKAFGLVAGSMIAAVAIAVLVMILLLLLDATRFRKATPVWTPTRPLVLFGGIAVAAVSLAHQIVSAIATHKFATGHDFTAHAVDQALTKGVAIQIVDYVALFAGLALAAGMVATTLAAFRVGLIPRWMMILGAFTALLIFLPIGGAELQVIPAFWMVMIGILYIGKWPNEEPPAWAAGEARPWPSAAAARAARRGGVVATAGGDMAPAPAKPVQAGTSRKRRKGGSRG